MDDLLIWKDKKGARFIVKSVYEMLELTWSQKFQVLDLVWKNATPLKVRCFGRLSWVGRVKNSEWLLRLGILVEPDHGLCKLCGSGLETVNHLLIW